MVGYGASAHHYATALGADAGAIGDYSIAIGGSDDFPYNPSPKAVGYRSIAIGQEHHGGWKRFYRLRFRGFRHFNWL